MSKDHFTAATATPAEIATHRTTAKLPAVIALVFGIFMLLGAGFAGSSTIHDAAHDGRHAFSMPCH